MQMCHCTLYHATCKMTSTWITYTVHHLVYHERLCLNAHNSSYVWSNIITHVVMLAFHTFIFNASHKHASPQFLTSIKQFNDTIHTPRLRHDISVPQPARQFQDKSIFKKTHTIPIIWNTHQRHHVIFQPREGHLIHNSQWL